MSSRLRSGVVWRISLTWNRDDLPKMVTTGARLMRSSCMLGSDSGGRSLWWVLPKAAMRLTPNS